VQVSDGDTITVLAAGNRQVRVRLAWVDAPERGQAFANASRQSLRELVAGRTVRVIERDVDRYGRTVGTVEVDGLDVCLEQLQRGLAWVFERYIVDAPAETQREYREVQELARWERKGLWKDKDAIPPWEFGGLGSLCDDRPHLSRTPKSRRRAGPMERKGTAQRPGTTSGRQEGCPTV
jgi:endonuclease YncB( thermonuclease family)